jgi:hypothetical protein
VSKSFNPLRALEPQRIIRERTEDERAEASEVNADRVSIDAITSNRVRKNFIFYAAKLLEALDTPERQINLQDYCHGLVKKYSEDSIYNGDFLSFIIEMNRDKKIGEHSRVISLADGNTLVDDDLKTIEEVFIKAALAIHIEAKINQVTVTSLPEQEIELLPGLKITNMLFIGERKR